MEPLNEEGETNYGQSNQNDDFDVKKTKSRTLLTNKKELRPSAKATAKLEKLNHTSLISKGETMKDTKEFSVLKTKNLTKEEQEFTVDYRKLEDLEREKGIKFFECIGDPPIESEYINQVNTTRDTTIVSIFLFFFGY
jgi:hypothetical protein